jgi:hypothetical protein
MERARPFGLPVYMGERDREPRWRETMRVNHLCLEIYNREKGMVTYKNSWITNMEISKGNVENMTARAR